MVETRLQRKRYIAARNWAYMNTDILCSIFSRLPYVDLLRVKSICWGWNEAMDVFKSCSSSSVTEMPWLIYTPEEEEGTEGEKNGRFVNFEENKTYPFNDLAVKEMNHGGSSSCCIGSSHDWLICLNERAVPYLLNPFTSQRIDLPRFGRSLGIRLIRGKGNKCCIETVDRGFDRNKFVSKAVLSSSPSFDNKYYLVITYGFSSQLAFCKDGDTSWTKLHSNEHGYFNDILFHDNNLYGVYHDFDPNGDRHINLTVWGLNQDRFVLEETKVIIVPDTIIIKLYLVEFQGSLLVVQWFDVYRRRSIDAGFHVFKFGNWLKRVKCLSGFALFLGRNQSISRDVRDCKMFRQDAIYFNDGTRHISGVFSLKDDSFDWFYENNREIQRSVPTWVVPPMKRLDWKSTLPNGSVDDRHQQSSAFC